MNTEELISKLAAQIDSLDELEHCFSSKGEFAEFKQKLETMNLGRDFQ